MILVQLSHRVVQLDPNGAICAKRTCHRQQIGFFSVSNVLMNLVLMNKNSKTWL